MTTRRLFARALAGLAVTLLLLGAFAWGAVVALSRGWQRERVRAAVEAELSSALADAGIRGELRIGAITGPLYPRLELHDLTLRRDGVTLLRVGVADLELDLRRLYPERRVIVSRLLLQDAALSLAPDASGTWPWELEPAEATPVAGPDEERPFSLEIRELVIAAARVDGTWTQAGRPSHVSGTLAASLDTWALPRAGNPGWPASASASLALDPGLVGGRALLGAELAAALDGSRLRLAPSHLESAFGKLRVSGETDLAGWLDPSAPASAVLECDADSLDLAILLARPELAGNFGGRLRAEATHSPGTPLRDTRAELSLVLAKSRVGRVAIASGEVRASYDGGRWSLDRALIRSNAGRLSAQGHGDLDRIAALDAELEISDLGALAEIASADAHGAARAKLHLTGRWQAPVGSAELATRDLRVGDLALGSLRLHARSTEPDRYRIEPLVLEGPTLSVAADGPVLLRRIANGVRVERAKLRTPEGETLEASGSVSSESVNALRVEISRVALARVGSLAGVRQPLGGHLSGVVTADGPLPRPALAGRLAWDAPQLGDVAADSISVDLVTRDGVLRADGNIAARGRDLLRASFAMPWSARSDLSRALSRPETMLQISGTDLDLSLVQELAPATLKRVEGRASVRLELHGGTPEPSLDGELSIANAAWEIPALAQHFGPLDAHLVLDRESLRIDRFLLRAGDTGSAQLSGEVRLRDLEPAAADLQLAVHEFPFRWQTLLQATADGAIHIEGPPDALAARGLIRLSGLHYSLAGGTDPLLGEVTVRDSRITPRRSRAPRESPPDLYDRASVDVKVDIASDGRVQGQGANLEIEGQLLAAKRPGAPLLVTGAIDTQRGSYRIRGKTFIVERTHVAFTGRPDLDPDLDVRAMHRVRDIRVYALVTGRASAPQIQLSSDPPYPQDDVLALLLFGKTRDELGQQQAGALQSALAGTAGAAALDSLTDKLGFDIPIDTVEVEDGATGGDTRVGLGGYLTEDVFVRYGRGIGADAESDVRVDWRFRKHWSVETSISTRGDSSADLVWTYDY
jgi:autotransporter translocation and assembly factor TamB